MSENYSRKSTEKDLKQSNLLLLDNLHLRLCVVEKKLDSLKSEIDSLAKNMKNKWLSLLESALIACALIITAVLGI